MTGRARTWAPWLAMALVLGVALAVGASRPGAAPTPAQRASTLDAQLRCPSCEDVSVADSSAAAAVAIRGIVERRIADGQSDARIEAFLVSRYGQDILLRPPASGGTGAVWIAPLVVAAVALSIAAVFLWRRRRAQPEDVSAGDRLLVEQALAQRATAERSGSR